MQKKHEGVVSLKSGAIVIVGIHVQNLFMHFWEELT